MLSNFFSKLSIRSMEGILVSKITVLCKRLSETKDDGAIDLYHAFRCLTVDFITEVAFGESFNLLTKAENNTFNAPFLESFDLASESVWDLIKSAARYQGLLRAVADTVANFRRLKGSGKSLDHDVVFDSMSHLDDKVLLAEATDILVAGSQDYELVKLEQLPFLTACINEAMRYAMAAPGRLPRVVPDGELEKYLVTFSKGARQCLGINLAYVEATLTLAMLANRFCFTHDETLKKSDLKRMDNFTMGFEGTGIRAVVHEDKE
ncbi:cytochrome P450 [Clathrospora elynae]|uniref:Cytochrome P450 n=1 Tax=Clathrospora elynae TaxID=706981 RepID=A0A6A5S8N1_9PLEO|nr:cytochrome P450 [Clathrospora elynae]